MGPTNTYQNVSGNLGVAPPNSPARVFAPNGSSNAFSGNANIIKLSDIVPQADPVAPKAAPAPQPQADPNAAILAAMDAQAAQQQSLYKQILAAEQAAIPAAPQQINTNAIEAQALAAAQGPSSATNALYTQQLNSYLQNEAAQQQTANQQAALAQQGFQNTLSNTLSQNTQAEQFAGQQNALTQGNINTQAANYQLNSGNAQNAKIQALQQSAGQGGLTGSGVGAQQIWQAENAKNVADAQQQGQFQYNRNVANLSASNTFAQLSQSSQFAQTQEGQQSQGEQLDLNSYIRQEQYQQQQFQAALSQWQQQAQQAQAWNQASSQISNIISNIGNAKVRGATQQEYGAYTGTPMSAPEILNQNSFTPGNFSG